MDQNLYISGGNFPLRSINACSQVLMLMDTAQLKNTVNGEQLKSTQQRKLWTRISGKNPECYKFLALEEGQIIKIGSMQRLWKKVSPGKRVKLRYQVCDNAVYGHDRSGNILCHLMGEHNFTIPINVEFLSYRPWLDMFVLSFKWREPSLEKDMVWQLEAEEV